MQDQLYLKFNFNRILPFQKQNLFIHYNYVLDFIHYYHEICFLHHCYPFHRFHHIHNYHLLNAVHHYHCHYLLHLFTHFIILKSNHYVSLCLVVILNSDYSKFINDFDYLYYYLILNESFNLGESCYLIPICFHSILHLNYFLLLIIKRLFLNLLYYYYYSYSFYINFNYNTINFKLLLPTLLFNF